MAIFCVPPADNTVTSLVTPYIHNVSTAINLVAGAGVNFGSPSPSVPVRFAMIRQSQVSGGGILISDRTQMGIYYATGLMVDTLTGVVFESGTNQDFMVGDFVYGVVCRQDIRDLQDYVNTISNPTITVGNPIVGGSPGAVLYTDLSTDLGASSTDFNYDQVSGTLTVKISGGYF